MLIIIVFTCCMPLGCGSPKALQPETSTCVQGQAIIAVFDGLLQNLCGCQETPGTYGTLDTPLTCTVSAGSRVAFFYSNTQLIHQLIPAENSTFVASPVSDPNGVLKVPAHEMIFDTQGIYRFRDAFNTGIRGQIIVQ
ncbi:MAG: hypothetical protein A2070_04145 [Bdellovibrionales bacterium GWC1_52_8]|nr:MAG: hypothetical protein A2070_04145 [Bdellovibrionales bacterium GWC1_52_8]